MVARRRPRAAGATCGVLGSGSCADTIAGGGRRIPIVSSAAADDQRVVQFAGHGDGMIDVNALRLGEQPDQPQLSGGHEGREQRFELVAETGQQLHQQPEPAHGGRSETQPHDLGVECRASQAAIGEQARRRSSGKQATRYPRVPARGTGLARLLGRGADRDRWQWR